MTKIEGSSITPNLSKLHGVETAEIFNQRVATAGRDRAGRLSASTHGRSLRPPWLVYTAASVCLSPCRWWLRHPPAMLRKLEWAAQSCMLEDSNSL